jgi:hypothetical protein
VLPLPTGGAALVCGNSRYAGSDTLAGDLSILGSVSTT